MGPPGPRGRDRQRDRARTDRTRRGAAAGRARAGFRHRSRWPSTFPLGRRPCTAMVGENGAAVGAGAPGCVVVAATLTSGGSVLGDRLGPGRREPRIEGLRAQRRDGTGVKCACRRPRVGGPFAHVTPGRARPRCAVRLAAERRGRTERAHPPRCCRGPHHQRVQRVGDDRARRRGPSRSGMGRRVDLVGVCPGCGYAAASGTRGHGTAGARGGG